MTPEERANGIVEHLENPNLPGYTVLMPVGVIRDAIAAMIADAIKAEREERDRARGVAADLMDQYMGFREGYIGHEFMSAQEDAIEYFEDIGWLRAEPLERYWWAEASGRAKKNEAVNAEPQLPTPNS